MTACFKIDLFTNPAVEPSKLANVCFNCFIGVFVLFYDNLLSGDNILTVNLILKSLMFINNYDHHNYYSVVFVYVAASGSTHSYSVCSLSQLIIPSASLPPL